MCYSVDEIVFQFETGIYIFSNYYFKAKYDYILKYGWRTILPIPLS